MVGEHQVAGGLQRARGAEAPQRGAGPRGLDAEVRAVGRRRLPAGHRRVLQHRDGVAPRAARDLEGVLHHPAIALLVCAVHCMFLTRAH